MFMKEKLTKKAFRKLKEVACLYKLIHKYKLQTEAYKASLKTYIDLKTEQNKESK